MDWTNLDSQPRSKIPQPGEPLPPETIHGVFFRYMFLLGLFCGVGRMGESISDPMLGVFVSTVGRFISTFGYATTIAFIVCAFYEWRHTERKWNLYQKMKEDTLPQAKRVTEISNYYTTSGGVKVTVNQYETDKLPPQKFIEWLFRSAAPDGRIPSERAIRESEWSQSAFNDWLSTMDKEGTTVKIDSRPNAARRIQGTLEDAYKHFGYETTKEQGK